MNSAQIGIIGGPDGPTAIFASPDFAGGLAARIFTGSLGPVVALIALAAVIAYFIGNISPSTLLARARGIDIKKEGSGNAGTTNALRVMGKKAAIITLVVDILKGVVSVLIGWGLAGQLGAMVCVLFVMLGHVWPLLLKFKGGKGIATSFGALLALDPLLALIELAIVAAVTLVTKRMSAGSIAGLVLLPVICIFRQPAEFVVISIILAVIMLIKHKANIIRIIHGEEPKLSILDKKSSDSERSDKEEEQ